MVSPVVINKLRRVVFSKNEPDSTVVLWGKPVGDAYAFLAYTNGSWQPLQTSSGGEGGDGGESYAPVLIKIGEDVYAAVDGTIELPEYPTTLPASDVQPWAKANSKPSYDYSEINNTPQSLPASDVPSWAKQQNKPTYNYSEIQNTPNIPDVSNFITKSVNDLANYYLKSETYTKTEVENLIAAISQFHYEIAASTSAVTNPANNVLYLIGPTGSGSDKYEEYVYPNSTAGWTKIGDTSIDLSGYVTTGALSTALAAYTTTTDLTTLLGDKVDKVAGKQLSTEDYITVEKTKLAGIEEGAQVNIIEGVKVDDTELAIYNKKVNIDLSGKANKSEMSVTTSGDKTTITLKSGTSAEVLNSHQSLTHITEKIPEQATSSNQLADKNFVNSSIATATATFRGTSASGLTEEQFFAWADTLTADANDYIYWNTEDNAGNTVYKRYKYTPDGWTYEYSLNNSSFTANEWAAIQSCITSELVGKLSDLPNNSTLESSLNNKVDRVTGKQLSTEDYTTTEKNKLAGIASNAQVNVLEGVKVNGTNLSITDKKVDITVPTKTSELTNDDNVVKDASYTHTDNNYTTTEKTKLSGIESNAQVNILEGVKVDGEDLTINDKKVNIDLSGKVDVADSETNSEEFIYRQTGGGLSINAKNAVIKEMRGKTLAWNQVVYDNLSSNFGNLFSSVTKEGSKYTCVTKATSNYANNTIAPINSILNHKYYIGINVTTNELTTWCVITSNASNVTTDALNVNAGQTGCFSKIITKTLSSYGYDWVMMLFSAQAAGLNFVFDSLRIFDLTLMFGQAVADTMTVAKFEALYLPRYYSYNAGQLINNSAKAIESVGFNLWDEEWELGSLDAQGNNETSSAKIRSKNYNPIIGGSSCYFKAKGYICFYDANKTFISSLTPDNDIFSVPAAAYYFRFNLGPTYGVVYNKDICVNLSNTAKNGTYEPYKKVVTDLNLQEIKVKSPNIWDEEWENGSFNESGVKIDNSSMVRTKNFIPILPDTNYYCYCGVGSVVAYFYDASKNFISSYSSALYTNIVTRTPSNAKYLMFRGNNNYGSTYNNNICINLSDPGFNGKYFPHGILTFNGVKSAGSVYDEISADGRRLIRRVGDVDLGTLTWERSNVSEHERIYTNQLVNDIKKASANTAVANINTSRYIAATENQTYVHSYDKIISVDPSSVVYIYDSVILADTTKVNLLNGVYLNYELANPEVYELVDPIHTDYKVDKLGTERIISDTVPISPFCADITYYEANIKAIEIEGITNYLRREDLTNELYKLDLVEKGAQSTSPELDVETFSGASLTAALNKYYDASADVGTLAVTLPAVGGSKTKSIMMHLTTASSPNITFTSADNKAISYYSTYEIAASKEYEISIVFNGTKWIIDSTEIATS